VGVAVLALRGSSRQQLLAPAAAPGGVGCVPPQLLLLLPGGTVSDVQLEQQQQQSGHTCHLQLQLEWSNHAVARLPVLCNSLPWNVMVRTSSYLT
jgi:hypothetical protein